MKVALCSDLHLEFAPLTLENPGGVEVLILSGDILVERDLDEYNLPQIESGFDRKRSTMWHTFFEEVSAAFPHVIYVAGNHEHYHGDFKYTTSELKKKLARLKNVHVLDKEVLKMTSVEDGEEYTFIGSTLWTDMNGRDPITLFTMKDYMNDFRIIKNSNREVYRTVPLYKPKADGGYELDEKGFMIQIGTKKKAEPSRFSPEDCADENEKCFGYIKEVVSNGKDTDKFIVVGHHTPSHQSCHPRWQHDTIMNGGYHNNYEEYIIDHPQIKLWTHGHTHEKYDYMIGETRVCCNPRGYKGHEMIAEEFELKVIEL